MKLEVTIFCSKHWESPLLSDVSYVDMVSSRSTNSSSPQWTAVAAFSKTLHIQVQLRK